MDSFNNSDPLSVRFSDLDLHKLYVSIAVYMNSLPEEATAKRKEIEHYLQKLSKKGYQFATKNNKGRILFEEIFKVGSSRQKVEEVFAIFKAVLPPALWFEFLFLGIKLSLPLLKDRYWYSCIIKRIEDLVCSSSISKYRREELAVFLRASNFPKLALAISRSFSIKASFAIDVVFQKDSELKFISDAFADAESEKSAFVGLFIRTDLPAFKASLNRFPDFCLSFFYVKLLKFKTANGQNLLDVCLERNINDLIDFLTKNCPKHMIDESIQKYELMKQSIQNFNLNPTAAIFHLPQAAETKAVEVKPLPQTQRASSTNSSISRSENQGLFLSFIYIYLEQLKIDLMKFMLMYDRSSEKNIYIEQVIWDLNTFVFDLIKENPNREKDLSLKPGELWSKIEPLKPKRAPKINKLDEVRRVFKFLAYDDPKEFPYRTWNFFVSFHLQCLAAMYQFPDEVQVSSEETSTTMFSKLTQLFSERFLVLGNTIEKDQPHHNIILKIASEIDMQFKGKHLGLCGDTLEYGLTVVPYLYQEPFLKPKITTNIYTEIETSIEQIDELKIVFETMLKVIQKKYPLTLIEQEDKTIVSETSVSFSFTLNGKRFIWSFSTCLFKDTIEDRIFPIISLAYNLNKRTIYNPIDSMVLAELILPLNSKDVMVADSWKDFATDIDTVIFILEAIMLSSYYFNLKHKSPILAEILATALPSEIKEKAAIKIFNKKACSLAAFHLFIWQYQLGFIFGLTAADDNFLKHIYENIEGAIGLEHYEYIGIILYHVYRNSENSEDKVAKINSLAAKFLEPQLVNKIFPLILTIESLVNDKRDIQDSLVAKFSLKSFYDQTADKAPNRYMFMKEPKPATIVAQGLEVKSLEYN